MKLITWNVNSIRTRKERVLAALERHEPDILCLQETKVPDEVFPHEAFEAAGYHAAVLGQRGGYNGVAILSRLPLENVVRGFSGDPIPEEARVISADVDGVRVVCVYVVNGQAMGSDKFSRKLAWLDAFTRWLEETQTPSQPLVVAGDFNIAPDDRDLHDPSRWEGKLLCTLPERTRLQAIYDWGLSDLLRATGDEGQVFSWWDYRFGSYWRDLGLRIDLVLGTPSMVRRCAGVSVDRGERDPKSAESKPSDHAPVIAVFEDIS
ncbi:MAG: exodeoxyribonuclease III [Deltaproteobacteria bacterium]|nr:exodeoxyribonuclease III [Deltaproteobacteria bacterium]